MSRLTSAEAQRLNSWVLEIAGVLHQGDTPVDNGEERHYPGHGGFHVNKRTGAWYAFGPSSGGWSAIGLIALLKGCSINEALVWGAAWLQSHAGVGGSLGYDDGEDHSETRRRASQARAREIRDTIVDAEGTAAELYLRSRGLEPPYPPCVKFLGHARLGEHGFAGVLEADGRVAGYQCLFLTPMGTKSLVEPVRQRFDLETAPHAVFEIQPATNVKDLAADVVICEGLEDALSVATLGRNWRLIGVPGINFLKHVKVRKGERVIVVRDGDEPGSAADKGLIAGLDHLLLEDAVVKVTNTPKGKDANDLFQEKGGKPRLTKLLAGATPAKLSRNGEFDRLAQLDDVEFDRQHRIVAKEHGISVATVRKEVARRRPKPVKPPADEEDAAGVLCIPEDPPWAQPLPALSDILEGICAQLRRYVVISEAQITAISLWLAACHLLQSKNVQLELFPKLAIQSKDPASGKTTLLTLIWNVLPRAKLWTYPSGAFLVRAIEQGSPSLCLDELQYAEDRNLLRVINASHQRSLAFVPLLVPTAHGGWIPREFPVWVPMALARLGEFSTAQQSRSIVIWMLPKMPGEERERLRRAEVPELGDRRRQLAAWADTVTAWLNPPLPKTLLNRDGDNWEPLLGVADMASPEWGARARKAAEELMTIEHLPTVTVRLLASIWKIFQPDPDEPPPENFIASKELIAQLIADDEEDWSGIYHSKPISFQWLRERLSHLLYPPGTTRETAFGPRGYAFPQFRDAFNRYLGAHPLLDIPPKTSGSSGSSGTAAANPRQTRASFEPDEKPDAAHEKEHPAQAGSSKSAKDTPEKPPEPDEPDEPGSLYREGAGNARDATAAGAASSSLAEKLAEKLGSAGPRPADPDAQALGGHPHDDAVAEPGQPNGPLPTPPKRRRRSTIAEIIRQTKIENPGWSDAQIAKRIGRAASVVRRILEEAAP